MAIPRKNLRGDAHQRRITERTRAGSGRRRWIRRLRAQHVAEATTTADGTDAARRAQAAANRTPNATMVKTPAAAGSSHVSAAALAAAAAANTTRRLTGQA